MGKERRRERNGGGGIVGRSEAGTLRNGFGQGSREVGVEDPARSGDFDSICSHRPGRITRVQEQLTDCADKQGVSVCATRFS